MFNFEVYRQLWIFFALSIGVILTLVTVLAYLAVWRARGTEREAQLEITGMKSFIVWFQRVFPWVLILTLAGTWLLAILYPMLKAADPPNW